MHDLISKKDPTYTLQRRGRPLNERVADFANPTSSTPTDQTIFRKTSCSCGGGCPACQTSSDAAKVSQPNDRAEIEADAIADRVMRSADIGDVSAESRTSETNVYRKADPASHGETNSELFSSSGRQLDPHTREFFEPRFGRDLSDVRIHTDPSAAQSARSLSAKAFTQGRDIGFAHNAYAPSSAEGKRLIAHEIAHVVQQDTSGASDRIQREFSPFPGQEGTDATDSLGKSTLTVTDDMVSERVLRTDTPGSAVTMPILIEFDKRNCTVTSSMEVNFVTSSDPTNAVSDDELTDTKNRFFEIANDKLNGWVAIEVGSDEKCDVCAGRTMRVKIVAKEGNGEFASQVSVQKRGTIPDQPERATSTTFPLSTKDPTLWHEAGHIVLGAADEYQEKNPKLAKRPEDKVNPGDNSAMDDQYRPHASLHARHFSHIAAWLGRKFPACSFQTQELYKFTGVSFRVPAPAIPVSTIGYGNLGGRSAFFAGGGYDLGIPLTSIGDWQMFVGAHLTYLLELDDDLGMAFLAGARVGFEKAWSTDESGPSLGGFVEGGGAFVSDRSAIGAGVEFLPGGYGYGGVNAGYKVRSSGFGMTLDAEIGGGFTSPLQLHDTEKLVPGTDKYVKDEKMLPFFTAGFRAAWMF